MKTRKLVLLIADVVLLAVCIVQCAVSAHDTTKYFSLKDKPDSILIDTPEEKGITVFSENGEWFVGKDKFPANQAIVDSFIDAVTSIRVLDKVAVVNDSTIERYEFDDTKKTVVQAMKDGKVLRTIVIGKEAMSNSQCYITVDNGKDIYLATGNLSYTFDTITSAIRTEQVFNINSAEITSVSITDENDNTWSVSRMGSGEDVAWNVSGAEIEVDGLKAASWFGALANLSTKNWYELTDTPEGTKVLTAKITYAFQTISVELYAIPKTEGVPQAYFGRCSETDYPFSVSSDIFKVYSKTPEELAK